MRKNVKSFQKCGHSSFERLVGVRVGVPACINTLALLLCLHGSTNLHCVYVSRVCMLNLNLSSFYIPEISTFIRTDMTSSARLSILIKVIYTLCGRKRFLLPATYFSTNLLYPFSLRVTGK